MLCSDDRLCVCRPPLPAGPPSRPRSPTAPGHQSPELSAPCCTAGSSSVAVSVHTKPFSQLTPERRHRTPEKPRIHWRSLLSPPDPRLRTAATCLLPLDLSPKDSPMNGITPYASFWVWLQSLLAWCIQASSVL